MFNNLKIKPLSKEQIIISLDRLTRFKPTEEKYLRVFDEIISANLIEPKIKKNQINSMKYEEIVFIINKIFDKTIKSLNLVPSNDYTINKKLFEYENEIYKLDTQTKKLLKNKIDFKALLPLIPDLKTNNLTWLKHIEETNIREKYATKFPIKKVVLVEGITEEILLPAFAKVFGYDFDKNGIEVISAGGKNQSVKIFYSISEILKLPVYILFDSDAKENCEEIQPKLRKFDKIHILKCGEFEDTLSLQHIKRALNNIFRNYYTFSVSQLKNSPRMTKTLEDIFKNCGQEFKKSEFAYNLSICIKKEDITSYIKEILAELQNL